MLRQVLDHARARGSRASAQPYAIPTPCDERLAACVDYAPRQTPGHRLLPCRRCRRFGRHHPGRSGWLSKSQHHNVRCCSCSSGFHMRAAEERQREAWRPPKPAARIQSSREIGKHLHDITQWYIQCIRYDVHGQSYGRSVKFAYIAPDEA